MRKIYMILSVIVAITILAPVTLKAEDVFKNVCQAQQNDPSIFDSSVCSTPLDSNPVNGPDNLVTKIANIIAVAGGVIAVIFIMIAGLTMITSSGDSKKVTEARNTAIYASVGIVVIVLARTILAFITRTIK
ncbi:MAG: pilin [Candidatus Saccharibacteria bacterium]